MWIATVDVAKAFDTMRLIEAAYINLLKRLHADQKATVLTDKESDVFERKRETKQGDPRAVYCLTRCFRRHWKMSVGLGDHRTECFCNLRSADDVLLFSASLEQLKRIMSDSKRNTEKVVLKIHPDTTKTLSNQGSNKRTEVTIDNKVEEKPARECAKCLGQTITFEKQETTEIQCRSRAAWTPLTKYKRVDIEIIPSTSQTPLIQHDHSRLR